VAGLDERSRRLMETASMPTPDNGSLISETGSYHLDADAVDDLTGNVRSLDAQPASTMRVPALKNGGTLDFDIGEPEHTQIAKNGAVDLDIGTATVPDVAFTATQRLGTDDLALPDLEPVTMSEVGTKLDLARAYMDMGDPEGARNILEEVLTEGSVAQKQEAQRLISSLPG
jgi:FimV-like protein